MTSDLKAQPAARISRKKVCRLFCASLFKEKVLHGNGLILKFILLQLCMVIWGVSKTKT